MEKQELLELRLDGMTYKQIGIRAGVSRQRIQQLLCPPKNIREFVINKFGGRCNRCNIFVGESGHIHHNGNNSETYNDVENLELLCIGCHRRAHAQLKPLLPKDKARKTKMVSFRVEHEVYEEFKKGFPNVSMYFRDTMRRETMGVS